MMWLVLTFIRFIFNRDSAKIDSMRDQQIADLIARENHRQVEGMELIASENYTQ